MKITNTERVHVLNNQMDVWSVIREIASSELQEDAFYICDIGDIVRKHKIWTATLPRIKPHYAVKCNDSLAVLEVLAALGTGFDCASKTEINKILSLGVEPKRIIFANPAKPASHIRHALATGVDLMTFDNETELYKMKDMFPDARMVIRIRCDATVAQCPLGMKFGCNPFTEAPHLLHVARSLGINVTGVSFHVGSGCKDPPVFRKAIMAARQVFDYATSLGYDFNLLDIGGGFPGDYGTSIEKIAEIINLALDDYFSNPSINIIAEPGRFYVSSAYTLTCNVHSIRSIKVESPLTGHTTTNYMYYINDGVYGSFNCILYDHQKIIAQPLKKYSSNKVYSSSIWGPTCDGLDQVLDNIPLPEMKLGDWIVFENMGAYTLPVASPFNGFPVPKVHTIADESIWLLLKDLCAFDKDHFVIENTPNLQLDLDIKDADPLLSPSLPISISVCRNGIIEEHVLDFFKPVNN